MMKLDRHDKSFGYPYTHSDGKGRKWAFKKEKSLTAGTTLNLGGADFYFKIDYDFVDAAGTGAVAFKQLLTKRGIDQDMIRRIGIATYEAEANVVIHSTGTGHIYGFINTGHVIVVVFDNGIGIENIDTAMKEGFTTASDEIRDRGFGAGMGLPNMKRYSDQFVMMSEKSLGTRVEMIFRLE